MEGIFSWLVQGLDSAILPLIATAVVLSALIVRRAEPSRAIFGRWALWICVSCGTAILLSKSEISSKPTWSLALFCMLLWVFIETVYNWLAIDAISRSGMPLFPSYKRCEGCGQWPADKAFIKLRELLRKLGFKSVGAAVGQIDGVDYLRINLFENALGSTRLSLLFMPRGQSSLSVFYSLATLGEKGERVVTDNVFIPFGGFYPENVYLERHPLVRSLSRLMKIHDRRVEKSGISQVAWDVDPIDDMNAQQDITERLNVNLGFLVDPAEREERGIISREGRYRLWSELWTLNYLGKPKNYC